MSEYTGPKVSGGAQPSTNTKPTPVSNAVTLILGGKVWSGWTAVRIGRGVERFPSDFELALTERYPGEAAALIATPGTSCVVKIGSDVLITGAIDRYSPAITPNGHEVRIHGRSRCADLVDCSAGIAADGTWTTQVTSGTILSVAQAMAKPFGITVSSTADAAQQSVPPFNVNLGETAAEIIDRITRWGGLLYFDDTAGDLVLAQVGTQKMASGFQEGVNIEAAGTTFSADERFSEYDVVWMSTDALHTLRDSLDGSTNGNSRATIKDSSKPALRFRPHVIVSEQTNQAMDFGQMRGTWEMNRRNGRSRAIKLTTDTWRDSAGKLWQPNTLTTVDAPSLKVSRQQWLIGEVTYRLDVTGTHADLTLMPPEAYAPEPFNLQQLNWQVAQALNQGAARKIDIANPGAGPAVTNPDAGANGNPRAGEGAGL